MTNLFKVEGQTLTPIEIYPAVSDTVNYLTFAFMFSYDWAGLTKSAIFAKGTDVFEVVLTDDQVLESDRVNLSAGTWSISVVGDLVVDAVVTRQITTTSYDYTVTQSGATSGGVFPPSVISQIYINTNQATPQTFAGGIPKLAADRVIDHDNEIADKKYVDDHTTLATVHNALGGLQGGSAGEYYHTTQAQNAALHAHSNKVALDAVSGTNTGDQDVSGAVAAHNVSENAHFKKFADYVPFDYLARWGLNNRADWDEDDTSKHAYILNKPTIPTTTSELANDSGYATESYVTSAIAAAITGAIEGSY